MNNKKYTKNSANVISEILDDRKKTEVNKYRYYSESVIESEPEAYNSYGYDESNGENSSSQNENKKRQTSL